MDLAFASSLQYPLTGNRSVGAKAKTFVSTPNAERNLSFRCLAREVAIQHRARVGALFGFPFQDQENVFEIENRKQHLLKAIQETQRGLVTTAHQRSSIEEALVSVESYDSGEGEPIDLNKLDGTWRLQYTSAPDVLILLEAAARLPFFQVGQIFQKFECQGQSDGGFVRNVVRWSIPNLLEIAVQNINISEELQALVAPAILPRSFLSLLAIGGRTILPFISRWQYAFGSHSWRWISICVYQSSTSYWMRNKNEHFVLVHTRILAYLLLYM
ncbi:probable plastid-lipid-associated protein 10, chloroplastic isoform X4 [Cornus florida]|uniref:probable plastid-lipid-associated protein 10, chloroplastic isoform X4 n=1 Tax=Cornus florida TaxID=4283 RepID=UPI00289E27DD|nr:probable plastid-lipid-associated protein 10, chloroplastic isoform X4 [Cornus florida]